MHWLNGVCGIIVSCIQSFNMRIFITVQYFFCEQGDNFNAYLRCHAENVYEGVANCYAVPETVQNTFKKLFDAFSQENNAPCTFNHSDQTHSLMIAPVCFTSVCGPTLYSFSFLS